MNTTASFRISKCESAIDLTWILAAATMLCTLLSPLECRAGVSPVVLQDFVDWEKQHRGSRIQVTDYDSAAKCFRMTPAVYNEEFAAMAIGTVSAKHSDVAGIYTFRVFSLPQRPGSYSAGQPRALSSFSTTS